MRLVIGTLMFVGLTGCAAEPTLGEYSAESQITNRLAANALSANRLAANRLAANGLADAEGAAGELAASPEGRELLTYLVSCVLPEGQELVTTTPAGETYAFDGALGLAPDWYAGPPSVTDRRWTTACLLARTNAFGVVVHLSLRGALPQLEVGAGEKAAYPNFEGAFFGDLWAPDPRPMNTCASALAATDPAHSTFDLRQCSQEDSPCGFSWIGACEDACRKNGGYACTDLAGETWPEVIRVYLER